MYGFWPTEAQRAAARFELRYGQYQAVLANFDRVPASRDVILEEVRQSPDPRATVDRLLCWKMSRLEP
jgi:hypothetical protein